MPDLVFLQHRRILGALESSDSLLRNLLGHSKILASFFFQFARELARSCDSVLSVCIAVQLKVDVWIYSATQKLSSNSIGAPKTIDFQLGIGKFPVHFLGIPYMNRIRDSQEMDWKFIDRQLEMDGFRSSDGVRR